jgi:hypothetical protein
MTDIFLSKSSESHGGKISQVKWRGFEYLHAAQGKIRFLASGRETELCSLASPCEASLRVGHIAIRFQKLTQSERNRAFKRASSDHRILAK